MDVEEENKRSSKDERSSSERFARRRRSRSRSRKRYQRSVSRSRSPSPFQRRGRFGRRSPPFRGGRNFRPGRFRRSRSLSRGRFDRKDRRFDGRRSRSNSPDRRMDGNFRQQQQQPQQMAYQADPYNNYLGVIPPQAPSFAPMNQFNSYDFQAGNYPPPAPNFSNIACPAPPGMADWMPQQSMAPIMPEESEEEKKKREAAIAEEKKRQREGLKMQRDQYIRRAEKMKGELKVLKDQKADLMDGLGKRSPSPKTNGFIKENEKLQSEISLKLSEILNVIDMLSGIIGKDEEEQPPKKKPSKRSRKSESDDSSPERIKSELLESMKRKKQEAEESSKKEKVNYVYFDNELHWCKHCQVFPKTAKDYLNHLHTKEHFDKISNRSTEGPWRSSFQKVNEVPNVPDDAPTKRVPIQGLQFFEPATAWFCKLCEMFMGDSWCVSLHLKSEIHSQRYNKLIEREPKFEEKWLEARNKAYELSGLAANDPSASNSNDKSNSETNSKKSDKKGKKKKNKKDSKKKRKNKKRKRGSSSSSDSEDNSDSSSDSSSSSKKNDSDQQDSKNSIRVAMRNMTGKASNQNNEKTGKWTMIPIDSKPIAPPAPTISVNAAKEMKKDEQIIGQWSTVEPIISQEEKRLLENLKGRLKTQQSKTDVSEEKTVDKKETFKERPRSRSRDRNKSDRNYRGRRSRSNSRRKSKSRSNSRRRSRSISRGRRSRSRGRYSRRSRERGRYSRSRSRGRYDNKKSSINFSTEPKVTPYPKEDKKQPSRSYSSSTKKDERSSSSSLANASKKMPFIGKMPVFKKQLVEKKAEEQVAQEKKEEVPETKESQKVVSEDKSENEKWDELMPDPMQFSAMMNAEQQQQQQQLAVQPEEEEVIDAPPGLDAVLDYNDIPRPISDAPLLKSGPLPKDFQATLDLLFDGDKPKKVQPIEPPPIEVPQIEPLPIIPPSDGPQMIMAEELSQHALLYGNYGFPSQGNNVQPVPPPPILSVAEPLQTNNTIEEDNDDEKNDSTEMVVESTETAGKSQEDLEDLALLGIDPNDVGSGLW